MRRFSTAIFIKKISKALRIICFLFLLSCSAAYGFTFNAGFWKHNYTVSYNTNSATDGTPPPDESFSYANTVMVASNSGSLARTGYTFGGWNTLANGSGTNYTAGSGTFTMGAADVTLYAKWNANSYTVTYNANGATSGSVPGSASYVYGSTVTVASNTGTLKRTGYVFGGWSTAANGGGASYTAGTGTFSMGAESITLYAKWTPDCSLASYSVPAPTVWPIGAQIINVRLAGQTRNFLKVSPGTLFNLTYDFNVYADGWCPGCVQQFYTGYSGQIQSACSSFSRGSTFKTISGKSVDLTAPATPGAYYLSTSGSLEFSCVGVTINPDPAAYFALICVQ